MDDIYLYLSILMFDVYPLIKICSARISTSIVSSVPSTTDVAGEGSSVGTWNQLGKVLCSNRPFKQCTYSYVCTSLFYVYIYIHIYLPIYIYICTYIHIEGEIDEQIDRIDRID